MDKLTKSSKKSKNKLAKSNNNRRYSYPDKNIGREPHKNNYHHLQHPSHEKKTKNKIPTHPRQPSYFPQRAVPPFVQNLNIIIIHTFHSTTSIHIGRRQQNLQFLASKSENGTNKATNLNQRPTNKQQQK